MDENREEEKWTKELDNIKKKKKKKQEKGEE
jgi:hypothetical protein